MPYDEQSFLSGLASGLTVTAAPYLIGQRISLFFEFTPNSSGVYECWFQLYNPNDDLTVIWENSSAQHFNVGECDEYMMSFSNYWYVFASFPHRYVMRRFQGEGPFVITFCGNWRLSDTKYLLQVIERAKTTTNYMPTSPPFFVFPTRYQESPRFRVYGASGSKVEFVFDGFNYNSFLKRVGIIEPAPLIFKDIGTYWNPNWKIEL